MIDAIRLTFGALREAGTPPPGEMAVRSLPEMGSGVYLGQDSEGRSHLLLESNSDAVGSTGIAAVTIERLSLIIDGRSRRLVDVVCEIAAQSEVFDHFVAAVAERLPAPEREELSVILDVLERWKRFLVSAEGPPGRDRLAGLFGELLVLLDVVTADPGRRVDAWVGPFGARHDLRRGGFAIEVKTSRAHTARVVTVHGEDQLVEPEGGSLHLHFVRLEEVPEGGSSVPGLIDDLLSAGADAGRLFDAVTAAGIPPADFGSAASIRFDVRERLTVPIDAGTPRIVPSSFAGGERPLGVVDLVYRLDLDNMLDKALGPSEWSRLTMALATTEGV